ncbi:thiol:disulfide interchange protein DsbA/DsbL [Candidatus Woesearchaeota archaeon]|nr:thiol:disulfide interchange protein DsbA/DsbL [Candidatus Woesearchaeota archaeon]
MPKHHLIWISTFLLLLGLSVSPLQAEEFKPGIDYERVTPPQPVQESGKVEVLEFFWYGCPHCYHFEPDLNAWLKRKPANVTFTRQPAIFSALWGAHAKAFFTAEALGVLDRLHSDFYDAIQNRHEPLEKEDTLTRFFIQHGVAEADFRKAYKSFAVDAKMRQAEPMGARYGITGTPSVIINGKYRISPSQARSFPRMIAIMDELIKQESHSK